MRGGEEENVGACVGESVPTEGKDWVGMVSAGLRVRVRQVGMQVVEVGVGADLGLAYAAQECRRGFVQTGVLQQETCQLAACVAADACDGDPWSMPRIAIPLGSGCIQETRWGRVSQCILQFAPSTG